MAGLITDNASSVDGTSCDSKKAIDVAQCGSVWRFAPQYIDLVAENQDLRFTPRAGPQQPNERATQQSEQLNHRPRASPDSLQVRQIRVSDKDSGFNSKETVVILACPRLSPLAEDASRMRIS